MRALSREEMTKRRLLTLRRRMGRSWARELGRRKVDVGEFVCVTRFGGNKR